MITYKEKDAVLEKLCTLPPEKMMQIRCDDLLNELELPLDDFKAILTYFQRIGFIQFQNLVSMTTLTERKTTCYLLLHLEAVEYFQRGGFTLVEEQLVKNLEKLELELEQLQSQMPTKIQTISSLISAIVSIVGFFQKG